MNVKLTSLAEAVSRIPSGSTIAIGGSMIRRQPNALIRELIRQAKKELTLLTFAAGTSADLLVAASAVKRWEGIYSGLFWYGQSFNFRRAVEDGTLEIRDFSEAAMVARLRAAAQGVSFAITRALLGTDIANCNSEQVRDISCPFTGKKYHALPAAQADFTLVHGYIGDEYGNVQMPIIRDSDDIDNLFAMASKRLIVSVERIVPHQVIMRHPLLTYIPHNLVEAIVAAPYGAHPVACDGFYNSDDAHMEEYVAVAKAGKMQGYLERYILGCDEWGYLNKVGGLERLAKLNVGGVA